MAGITKQPTAGNPFREFENDWQVGLYDCMEDKGSCAMAFFCPCIFMSRLSKDVGEASACGFCVPNRVGVYRMKVRSLLRIKGSAVNDCCAVTFCGTCAAIQMKSELKRRGLA